MIILCDLDGPIYDLDELWNSMHNADYPNHILRREDITQWNRAKVCKDAKCKCQVYKYFSQERLWKEGNIIEGAFETTKKWIANGHQVVIFTTVPKSTPAVAKWKLEWIHENLPHIGENVILTNGRNKHLIRGDVIIDDAPHNLEYIRDTWKFLYDMPHNKSYICEDLSEFHWNADMSDIYRIYDWEELDRIIP